MDYIVHGILQARILERVTFPLSRGSSQPRDRTQISHIAGGFFTRATREALTPTRMATIKKKERLSVDRNVKKLEPLYIASENVKCFRCYRKVWGFL